jgi:ATP-dependent DNA helicase RecG
MTNPATIPARYVKGVGPRRAESLAAKDITTVEDLLYFFPSRYEDRTSFVPLAKVRPGEVVTVRAQVLARNVRRSVRRKGFSITEASLGDASGRIMCTWFNQPYIASYLRVGSSVVAHGKVQVYNGRIQFVSPEFEIVSDDDGKASDDRAPSLDVGRIVPVYPRVQGISGRSMRKFLYNVVSLYAAQVPDILPEEIRASGHLADAAYALRMIHFPENALAQERAYERLSFEEFLLFQIPLALRKLRRSSKKGIAHEHADSVGVFLRQLPFALTPGQKKALEEITADMMSPKPMQRLLQGDVGSGKTVVAACAALIAVENGYQAAFMVPTEILAQQHYAALTAQLRSAVKARICVLTGSLAAKEKVLLCQGIAAGEYDIVIGTHALLQEDVRFKRLSLVIIDEQHKFGVGQRALLPQKGAHPDVLIMTATPIPRTLAITLYGDLDTSVILGMPRGRTPPLTMHVPHERRHEAYALVRREAGHGNQAYIIYPVIEETPEREIAGAQNMFRELSSGECRGYPMGLIHARLSDARQQKVMRDFAAGRIKILVATTILEVGIDVPAATCMVIENAERFGLSQLHQLRGRIGRGEAPSVCVLVTDMDTEEARKRVQAMVQYTDGFRIAEEDLKIRGPGQFFGSRQHGLTELRVGNPLAQLHLLKKAREEAIRLVSGDPALGAPGHAALRQRLLQRFPEYEKFLSVG